MLRITGWIVLNVVCGTLRGIGTRYGAVLLGYEPSTRSRLRGCKASVKEEEVVLVERKMLRLFRHLIVYWHMPYPEGL